MIFIGGYFNGHIGANSSSFDDVNGGFGFGIRNGREVSLLEFAKAFEMVIANSYFLKRENQLVTFYSSIASTQIDYLLLWKSDRGLCKDFKGYQIAKPHDEDMEDSGGDKDEERTVNLKELVWIQAGAVDY
ncbi:uncharacterized protein LOC129869783 [Solanum dulcamara]|uniref:uncharacterized protein LOC129869783 n=1 Tax=Solanum dulcamara TaxID=45834 RepID=UPI002485CB93|nr:uncharacterized protein LOC129869783 [Solanum dulcamara]